MNLSSRASSRGSLGHAARLALTSAALSSAALLAVACRDADRPVTTGQGPSVEATTLRLIEGTWELGEVETIAHLVPPTALGDGWRGSTEGMVITPLPAVFKGERATHLVHFAPSTGDQVLRIDGDFQGGSFDLVALRIGTSKEFRVRALFEAEGGEVATHLAHAEGTFGELQTVLLPFDANITERRRFKTLTIHLASTAEAFGLLEVSLLKRPPTMRFPSPLDEAQYVGLGEEFRPAVGLLPGRTLGAEIDGRGQGSLRVEHGLPEAFVDAGAQRLRVQLLREGAVVHEEELRSTGGWRSDDIDLGPLGGGPGEVRFALVDEDSPGLLVVPPRVMRRVSAPRTVLFVTSDTHRADHVGCMGGAVLTPTIDALAARGTLYRDCIATTTITNPSHVAMMTGLSLRDTRIYGNLTPLAERADTLAERFRAAGFRTFAAVSAEHLSPERSGLGQGFERLHTPSGVAQRDSAETVAAMQGWLEDAEGQDVFLWLHVFDAHTPYTPPTEDTRRYYGEKDPYDERLAELAPEVQAYWDRRIRDSLYILAQYKGEVTYLDRVLGQVLQHERLKDAHIALTADHGEALGDHGVYWEHRALYPSSLNVPLVIAGPGVGAGRVVTSPVQNVDLGRTLLELAGIDGEDFPGRSLVDDVALQELATTPRFAIGMFGTSASITHDGWYLVLHLKGHGWGTPKPGLRHDVELFDLRADPSCKQNLAAAEPERTKALRTALVRWLGAAEGPGLVTARTEDAAAIAQVASLGYATSDDVPTEEQLYDTKCACPRCVPFR